MKQFFEGAASGLGVAMGIWFLVIIGVSQPPWNIPAQPKIIYLRDMRGLIQKPAYYIGISTNGTTWEWSKKCEPPFNFDPNKP